ncbi:MAG: N-acetylmuramoyl-L-alanine amidase family protein [Capsulimonadaceae bacterium]
MSHIVSTYQCLRRLRSLMICVVLLFVPCVGRAAVICIDPGHPSEVGRGTQGRHSTEMGVAWQEALLLRDILRQRGDTVVMTKSSESQFVRNRARAEVANRAHADLMVRLHCDAGAAEGTAVYVPEHPGVAAGVRGPSPEVIAASLRMGAAFHVALMTSLRDAFRNRADLRLFPPLADRGLLPDTATQVGARQGALTGSVFSHVPVVLVEMCVLTNPRDERFITSPPGRTAFAQALADAVDAALRVRDGTGASRNH